MPNFYVESMPYEFYIRRAYECPRQMRNGADQCFMQNLMLAEIGDNAVRHLGSYEKQLEAVKKHLLKATDRLLKARYDKETRVKLREIQQLFSQTMTTSELADLIDTANDLTRPKK